MIMRDEITRLFLSMCLLVCAIGCADNTDDDATNLRFLNAVVGVGAVNMMVDFDEFLEDIQYLESTGYLDFDTDPHVLQITPANALNPIDSQRVALRDDVDYTYIACGDSREPSAILLQDNNEPPGDGNFKTRITNVFKARRGLDVFIASGAQDVDVIQPTAERLGFKATTQYRVGSSGVYDIIVRDSASGEIVATRSGQVFKSAAVYSVILVSDDQDPSMVQIVVLIDRV